MGMASSAFVVVGIPMIINELCKWDSGYETVWDAADVLSYYGTLLGSGITIITVLLTFRFTYKQLKREAFLEKTTQKWNKIDEIVTQALKEINPLNMLKTDSIEQPTEQQLQHLYSTLQDYSITSMTSITMLVPYVGKGDYQEIEVYLRAFQEYVRYKIMPLERRLEDEFATILKEYNLNGGKISKKVFENHKSTLSRMIAEITFEYNHGYIYLLKLKKKTFDEIYKRIEHDADRILY